ncbi:MAG: hypothetical protein V4605_00895 [Pseudomonadota bacterium]
MDTLIVLLIGFYLFIESFTAINEMPKARLRCIFRELNNPYTLKYAIAGLLGIAIMYHADHINGLKIFLIMPLILLVIGRTIYRFKQFREANQ